MTIDTIYLIKALEERKRQLAKWTDKDRAKERIDEIDCILDTDVPYLVKKESEKPNDIDFEQELYNHFGMVKDFTLGMRIAQCFYNLGRESGSSEIPNDQEPEVNLDFQRFAQEIQSIFTLPASETQNSEENPLKWEYAIARYFYELGKKAK